MDGGCLYCAMDGWMERVKCVNEVKGDAWRADSIDGEGYRWREH